MSPTCISQRNIFPYRALVHPLQVTGGQVFPKIHIDMFPRLERFDLDFDLPDAFLPECPPAIFLSNRPELGDVSRGEVVSINNYYRLIKDILTPVSRCEESRTVLPASTMGARSPWKTRSSASTWFFSSK